MKAPKNNYPTFPNPAGIGSGLGYATPPDPTHQNFIPAMPHPPITLMPQPGQLDPVIGSGSVYEQNCYGMNPWEDFSRDGR